MKSADRFGEDEARRILARAIELDDTQRDQLSGDQLARVAVELGLTPEALELAVAETRAAAAERQSSTASAHRSWQRALLPLAAGVSIGFLTAIFPAPVESSAADWAVLGALGACGLISATLVGKYRRRHEGWRLQRSLLALWSGCAVGLILSGRPPLDVLQASAAGWGLSTIAAIVAALLNQLYQPADTPAEPPSPSGAEKR